jgi:2-succinyl-5-enolpyruvyl-6-hydroxy-3-cyclohexene-1-carboxylate synthase
MRAANVNHLWAKLIISELVRNHVKRVCISSGSRSTPLAVAAAENDSVDTNVHYDERGAAFFALGYAKACARPVALICTSGTALANYYPAVVEASLSRTPLIILSSDRPAELRDCGAPQTINQVGIFGDYLSWFVDLPCPTEDIAPGFVLSTVDQVVYRSLHQPAGPVQLNCQFREPLAPLGEAVGWDDYLSPVCRWLNSAEPYTSCVDSYALPKDELSAVANRIGQSKSGLIVAGPLPAPGDFTEIISLSRSLGWPLIADIASGLRFQPDADKSVLSHFDLFLRSKVFQQSHRPDLVVHFGAPPTSKVLNQYLAGSDAHHIQIADHPFRHDPNYIMSLRLGGDPNAVARRLTESVAAPESALRESLIRAERVAVELIAERIDGSSELTEISVARMVSELTPQNGGLFLASSMPIRDCDAFAARRDDRISVGSNRGANGIDGTVASAAGFATGLEAATTVLLGDLALLHDLNSLALVRHSAVPLILVVINNNGGGIFHFLPVAEIGEYFESYFGTPHQLRFDKAAEMFGLEYHRPTTVREFRESYLELLSRGAWAVVEIASDRVRNTKLHRELWQAVTEALED